jgi:FtsP/CotA-like multicopper oxidase with cupredoxin domain
MLDDVLSRRQFVLRGAGAAFALGASGLLARPQRTIAQDVAIELRTCRGVKPMFNVTRDCPFAGFELSDQKPLSPGPVINAFTDDVLRIRVTNAESRPVGFTVEGLGVEQVIAPGGVYEAVIEDPPVGTYLYYDHLGVQRILGAHGAVVVRPRGADVPEPDEPAPTEYLWMLAAYDSAWGNRYMAGQLIDPASYRPDVFTINGRYGDGSSQARDTSLRHKFNSAVLIRMVNASPLFKSIHFHAEHPVVLSRTKIQQQTVGARKDTIAVAPLEVVTVLMSFAPPVDGYPLNAPAPGETDLRYPVHDHHELTNSLGGGAYPNGMLTELEFMY